MGPLRLLLALLFLPVAAASWHGVADPQLEPSTSFDRFGGYMWHNPWTSPVGERVYLNAFLSPAATGGAQPAGSFHAYLGLWKDCNKDGYIGSGALGTETYPALALIDTTVCAPGGKHHEGATVREFLWIGPGSSDVDDPDARVWADVDAPGQPATNAPKTMPDAMLHYDDAASGARWSESSVFAPTSHYTTAYARVGPATTAGAGGQLPSTGYGIYGAEPCAGWPGVIHDGWHCDVQAWPATTKLGDIFQLRDVDCVDPAAAWTGNCPY